ncbi:MAG: hypothetical protein AAB839_03285 [Patescibacteria group bacterium]
MWGESRGEGELLSREREAAMRKAGDIDTPGIGYSFIHHSDQSLDVLRRTLKDGLLGFADSDKVRSRTTWANATRDEGTNVAYFNIVGRAQDTVRAKGDARREIGRSRYARDVSSSRTAVLFDVGRYTEEAPSWRHVRDRRDSRTYRADDYRAEEDLRRRIETTGSSKRNVLQRLRGRLWGKFEFIDDEGRARPDSEFGFTLSHRVPSRNFTGIVFQESHQLSQEHMYEILRREIRSGDLAKGTDLDKEIAARQQGGFFGITLETDPAALRARAESIAAVMHEEYQGNPDRCLPIYDTFGNMWWPKEIPYQDLKRKDF